MGAGSSKAHQSYTVAPATTSSGSVSQVPAASVADLESLAAEPGHDSAAAVLLVDPVDAASAVVADPLPAPATPEDAGPPEAAAAEPWDEAVTPVPPTAPEPVPEPVPAEAVVKRQLAREPSRHQPHRRGPGD